MNLCVQKLEDYKRIACLQQQPCSSGLVCSIQPLRVSLYYLATSKNVNYKACWWKKKKKHTRHKTQVFMNENGFCTFHSWIHLNARVSCRKMQPVDTEVEPRNDLHYDSLHWPSRCCCVVNCGAFDEAAGFLFFSFWKSATAGWVGFQSKHGEEAYVPQACKSYLRLSFTSKLCWDRGNPEWQVSFSPTRALTALLPPEIKETKHEHTVLLAFVHLTSTMATVVHPEHYNAMEIAKDRSIFLGLFFFLSAGWARRTLTDSGWFQVRAKDN